MQLHVVEELLELLQADDQAPQQQADEHDGEILMSISKLATTGQTTPHTVRLLGTIAGKEMLILVDSGSSHSFVSEGIAAELQEQVQTIATTSVKIADGGVLQCKGMIPACSWATQGHTFRSDLRVLSLGCYDMVAGMDWLQQCGPMWVDWEHKTLQFQHEGEWIQLTGVQPKSTAVAQISAQQLIEWEEQNAIAHVVLLCSISPTATDTQELPEIAALLDEFQLVLQNPRLYHNIAVGTIGFH